ncbi:hypothetical protein [Oceanivirga miroungae]|uniref:Uncharacterized protein n=1 Tax=Oceanivirga miroungae TaxID=1130046 RepID=A0A6I8MFG3_9FUSO|nr:hypothetical protein [Oceanivirga miroungae]VWL85849.1 hypothetical protein OMES3154_01135 [Oceanivirga miroungae]
MKKEMFISTILLAISIVLAILGYILFATTSFFTTILVIFILLLPTIFDFILEIEYHRLKIKFNYIILNYNYLYTTVILYLLSLILYILNFIEINIIFFSIASISFIVANSIKSYYKLKYTKEILIYKSNTILKNEVKKSNIDKDNLTLTIDLKDKSLDIKFKNFEDLKKIYFILN